MRIHSDKLTVTDLVNAAHKANVTFTRNTTHGSKSVNWHMTLSFRVILHSGRMAERIKPLLGTNGEYF